MVVAHLNGPRHCDPFICQVETRFAWQVLKAWEEQAADIPAGELAHDVSVRMLRGSQGPRTEEVELGMMAMMPLRLAWLSPDPQGAAVRKVVRSGGHAVQVEIDAPDGFELGSPAMIRVGIRPQSDWPFLEPSEVLQ